MDIISKLWLYLRSKLHILHFSKIPPLCHLLYGYKIYKKYYVKDYTCNLVYNRYTYIGNEFFNGRLFEKGEVDFLKNKLEAAASPILIDIGANVGLHTINLAKAIQTLKVFSFEPSPKTYQLLAENIKSNNLTQRVTLFNLALSETAGFADFYETSDDAFNSLKDTGRREVKEITKVKVSRLDDMSEIMSLPTISLIKIDVEGFENEVLNGATGVLKKYMPDLFVEIYKGENSNLNPEQTINNLITLGYKAFVVDANGDLLPFVKHEDALQNYFFTIK